MRILAFDTASESCSVALTEHARLLVELSLVTNETHSRHLASMIREACRLARLELSDIDGYAVTRGPGSFTGLRIGISTAIGLAQASGKPIAGVSTLHALAAQAAAPSQLVCPMIYARRGEVYFSILRHVEHQLISLHPERALTPMDAISAIAEPCLFIGSGAVLYQAEIRSRLGDNAQFAADFNNTIRAVTVASLAQKHLANGDREDILNFSPIYLRKSDAEIDKSKGGRPLPETVDTK